MAAHRLLSRPSGEAVAGVVVAIYLVGFVVVAPYQWHRALASPDRIVALAAAVVLALFWVLLLARLVAAIVAQVRGRAPLVAGGAVVWLASMIVAIVTITGPTGAPTALSRVAPLQQTIVSAPSPINHATAPEFRVPANATVHASTPRAGTSSSDPVRPTWSPGSPPPTPLARSATVRDFSTSNSSSSPATATRLAVAVTVPEHGHLPWAAATLGALPLALIAKRRRDFLTQSRVELDDDDVDDSIEQLRHYDEAQLGILRRLIGTQRAGLVTVASSEIDDGAEHPIDGAVVVVVVAVNDDATLVAFARAGEDLPLGRDGADLVDRFGVVLSGRGQCRVATSSSDALRKLALRTSFDDVVVYLGPAKDLDAEVRQRCVALGDGPRRRGTTLEWDGRAWSFASPAPAPVALVAPRRHDATRGSKSPAAVRVQLLRPEPVVLGLVEPFAATLRRRCVEMTAYLAVHHREPITGERMRGRVLGSGDDASLRTLSNTATAVRRSLGSDELGPRLRPVTPAGLYQIHDVDCDLVEFHQMVASARDPLAVGVAATLRRALELVQGEPLATALRGFEWFLAEGHLARLQRDGEWAALRLADEARQQDDFDLAFWAIEQGRLIDPYSETLEAALHRVPRLREFGGDRSGGAEHEAVGAR